VGSTSGWLIPTHYFQSRGIDPKSFFRYRDGASHPANVTAVANSQVDLATDFDRNFNSMADRGLVKREEVRIVWTSEPLPNDPLVVRAGFDPAVTARIQDIVAAITPDEARAIMPPRYTGWVKADHASYRAIEAAGVAVGRLKPRS
jgi:phosphonate transport system substrate-binding protein